MKQHITVEQLSELTEEQKNKLRTLWKPELGDLLYTKGYGLTEVFAVQNTDTFFEKNYGYGHFDPTTIEERPIREKCLPLLSIGKMIDILENRDECLNIVKRTDLEGWGYEIQLRRVLYYNFSTGELCDALWSAVKAII